MGRAPISIETVEVPAPQPGSYRALIRCKGGPAIEGNGRGRLTCPKCESTLAVGVDPEPLTDGVIFRCECNTYSRVASAALTITPAS